MYMDQNFRSHSPYPWGGGGGGWCVGDFLDAFSELKFLRLRCGGGGGYICGFVVVLMSLIMEDYLHKYMCCSR